MYPKKTIKIADQDLNRYSAAEVMSIMKRIGATAKSLEFTDCISKRKLLPHFKKLDTLDATNYLLQHSDIQTIPSGLKRFSLRGNRSHQLKDLFTKLSPSLTCLHLREDFYEENLEELNQIRELEIYVCSRVYCDLLQRNSSHLEVLKIAFFDFQNFTLFPIQRDDFALPAMPKLRVLNLLGLDCNNFGPMGAFPCLEEIEIYMEIMYLKSTILKWISININNSSHDCLEWLYPLTNLTTLALRLEENQILKRLVNLPKLTKIESNALEHLTPEFVKQLKEFLIAKNRRILIKPAYLRASLAYP